MNDLTKQYFIVVKITSIVIVAISVLYIVFRTPELLGLLLGATVGFINLFITYRGVLNITEQAALTAYGAEPIKPRFLGTGSAWRVLLLVLAVFWAERSSHLVTYTVVIGAFLALTIAYVTFLYNALLASKKGGN